MMDVPPSHYEYSISQARYQPPLPNDISIPSLKNFQREAFDLYRSAQPLPWELIKLAKKGIDVVINFTLLPEIPLPNGPKHLIHIPSFGEYPSEEDVVDFLQVIHYIRQREAAGEPHKILVHCIFGKDRTGLMVAAYQLVFEQKSLTKVKEEYAYFGHTDFEVLEEMLGTPEKVMAFQHLAQLPPKYKYIRSFIHE